MSNVEKSAPISFPPDNDNAAEADSWRLVLHGLPWKIACGIIAPIASFLSVASASFSMSASMNSAGPAKSVAILYTVVGISFIVSLLCYLVGGIYCVAAPSRRGCRMLAIGAVSCILILVPSIFTRMGSIVSVPKYGGAEGDLMASFGSLILASLGAAIAESCFFAAIGHRFGNRDLSNQANNFLIFLVSVFVIAPIFSALFGAIGGGSMIGPTLIIVLNVTLIIIVCYLYVKMVVAARNTIQVALGLRKAYIPPPEPTLELPPPSRPRPTSLSGSTAGPIPPEARPQNQPPAHRPPAPPPSRQ